MMQRNLSGMVFVDGTDDEWWPFADEHTSKQYKIQMLMDESAPAAEIQIPHTKWGGECRVEVSLQGQVVGTGQVQLEGEGRLYEGTSEETTDLEDSKRISILVPKGGKTATHNLNLVSSGPGGGDHAEIRFAFTNSLYEEE